MFRTRVADTSISFPSVPWATEVVQDFSFSDLQGQLTKPGIENGPGPMVVPPDPSIRRRMKGPLTHFWEHGQWLDPYTQGEHIHGRLPRAIYGTFSNVKTMDPENYANIELEWVAYVPAQANSAGIKTTTSSRRWASAHTGLFPMPWCRLTGRFACTAQGMINMTSV